MKLLLHTCCGPCFLGVWEELGTHENIETTLFYSNPNIYPDEEWEKRRGSLRVVARENEVELIEVGYEGDKYIHVLNSFLSSRGSLDKDEQLEGSLHFGRDDNAGIPLQIRRCPACYRLRLENAARYAKENGYDAISTTLFVSPYQRHDELKKVAQDVCNDYGIDFYYTDWRPFFRGGQNIAKEMGIYRQKYCGCKYSLQESNHKAIEK